MVQVLHRLPKSSHPDLIVGCDHLDDGGVFRLNADTAIVQTLDFFPPLVDDPYQFGRIAAANALSDVYAMGGEPLTAMNIVGFPDDELPASVLVEVLQGGYERVKESGAVLLGGHSVRDREIKYGLSVTGRVHPEKVITNANAEPGDRLFLTKPLGSGTMASAAKKGGIAQADLGEAIEVMTHLNRGGRDAMVACGVRAATDVTGFGLVGHAFELADASGVTIEIEAAAVPLMSNLIDLATKGFITKAHKSTLRHVGEKLAYDGVDELLARILCDAQTSGGLLICVSASRAAELEAALKAVGTPCAAEIGCVLPQQDKAVRLV